MSIYFLYCLPFLIYIYIYIYIIIHRQTVLLYHTTSVCLDMQDVSSWDRNPADFMSIGYLTPKLSSLPAQAKEFYSYILIYLYAYQRLECTIQVKSFEFTHMWSLVMPTWVLNPWWEEHIYCPPWTDCFIVYICYLPNPSARAGYDTRSIFKWSLTGLNSEYSFS